VGIITADQAATEHQLATLGSLEGFRRRVAQDERNRPHRTPAMRAFQLGT
jgi:hypothetical protein